MTHGSKLEQLEAAVRVLGKRLVIAIEDQAPTKRRAHRPRARQPPRRAIADAAVSRVCGGVGDAANQIGSVVTQKKRPSGTRFTRDDIPIAARPTPRGLLSIVVVTCAFERATFDVQVTVNPANQPRGTSAAQ